MSVDPQVFALAWVWLDGSDKPVNLERAQSLAEAIQNAIDDWCEDDATPPHRLS